MKYKIVNPCAYSLNQENVLSGTLACCTRVSGDVCSAQALTGNALQGQGSFLEQFLFRLNAPAMRDKHSLTLVLWVYLGMLESFKLHFKT